MDIILAILVIGLVFSISFNIYIYYTIRPKTKKVEKIEEDEPGKLIDNMYDISAFKERMNKLRFSDGEMVNGVKLYNVEENNKSYKDSGVEVITEELEVALDKERN